MTDVTSTIQDLYSQGDMLDRVAAFLKSNGVDADYPSYEDLHVCDQMHARGIDATREHAERAEIRPGMHVLEVGCGIGGASRFLAKELRCRVTGIDLTQECVDVARELTRRCGLNDLIDFRQADATQMPLGNGVFDHVWSHNVTMNIQDKDMLAAEIARVLKSGGRYSCWELSLGTGKPPFYPLPWASDASSNFLMTPDEMTAALERGGLKLVSRTDLNDAYLAFLDDVSARAQRGEALPNIDPQALKDRAEFLVRVQNCGRSAREGLLVEHLIISEKAW
jgi:cyclopropane fatty-acyl-phospholipid synthase-like methyltransferase